MKNLFLTVIALAAISYSYAQKAWCGTDHHHEALMSEMSSEELKAMNDLIENQLSKVGNSTSEQSGTVYTIPIVVHILHDGCVGNISDAQVEDGVRVLNEDFRRINKDTNETRSIFKSVAADAEIQFKLAKIDENGNCTNGIVRYDTEDTYNANNRIKTSERFWGSSSRRYLNVWIVESISLGGGGTGTILGYAQFPFSGSESTFGMVVRNDQWGGIGSSRADGRTVTHEAGHNLGLFHTFQGGCFGVGDGFGDTPPTDQAYYSCSQTQNTCSNDASASNSPYTTNVVDQIENYMSYNSCQNMFTGQQVAYMRDNLLTINRLSRMISQTNLANTGTNDGYVAQTCAPTPDFCQDLNTICEFSSVTFTDRSYNGPGTSRMWSFPGGTPSSSSDSVVTVTYQTAGTYDVTLTMGNTAGSNTETRISSVEVLPLEADRSNWRYDENFEDQVIFDDEWTVVDENGGRRWELTDKASYSGSKSVYILNNTNGQGLIEELISPSFDISAVTAPRLTFKLAAARKNSTNTDQLGVYYSFDCGNRWGFVTIRTGSLLYSVNDDRFSEFIPADESEWREVSVNLGIILRDKENVQFKFEFESGGGNNIYIDDVAIESTTGIEEQESFSSLNIYPNPAKDFIQVAFNSNEMDIDNIQVRDISGRIVNEIRDASNSGSNGVISMDVSNYLPGIYFMQFTTSMGDIAVRKIVVN